MSTWGQPQVLQAATVLWWLMLLCLHGSKVGAHTGLGCHCDAAVAVAQQGATQLKGKEEEETKGWMSPEPGQCRHWASQRYAATVVCLWCLHGKILTFVMSVLVPFVLPLLLLGVVVC